MLTRRSLVAGSAAAALAAGANPAAAAAPPADKQAPGLYRYRIGAFELTALYDGIWYRPITEKFIRNAPFAEVEHALDAAFMPHDKLETPFTTLIVNTGKKLVLIDTGTGGQIAPTAGMIGANLAAAGIDPKAVDQIVISHFHPDHINGIKDKDNSLIFPNAEIMVPAPEWAYWMDDANLNAAPPDLKAHLPQPAAHFCRHRQTGDEIRAGQGDFARHRYAAGAGPHAGPHGFRHSFRRRVADGVERHRAASRRVRAASRLAGRVRHRRRCGGGDAQKTVRSRLSRPHAGDRLSLPVPGLRPFDQDRERLRACSGAVAAYAVAPAQKDRRPAFRPASLIPAAFIVRFRARHGEPRRPGTTIVRLAGERRAQRTPASRCIRSGSRPHHWLLDPGPQAIPLSFFALFDGAECELRRSSRLDLRRPR